MPNAQRAIASIRRRAAWCWLSIAPAVHAATGGGLAHIESLIGSAQCRTDADCRTLAIGQRACGGPDHLIAWSVRATDEAALRRAVADLEAKRRTTSLPGGTASTCVVLVDHGAACVAESAARARRCVLRAGASATPSAGTR